MSHLKLPSSIHQTRHSLWLFPLVLLFISMACSTPALFRRATPTPTSTLAPTATPALPTPTPQPLPPAVVETDPMQGVELGLNGSIILYFNQPMDRLSVEAALKSQTSLVGSYTWIDDTTLVFTPDQPLPPESDVTLDLGTQARSGQGLSLAQPVSYKFRTVGYLRLANSLPQPDTTDVNPTTALVAAFNYPVVPLGADPAGLPVGFTLEPAADGKGEWLNTSTYIFYPKPALEGGKSYTATINPELRGIDGSPLQAAESWTFTTALPRLVTVEPSTETGPYRLDLKLVLTFNQPMDPASVESHFALVQPDGLPVPGQYSWDERTTVMTFTPDNLLERNAAYTIRLDGEAQARGGTPLGTSFDALVMTAPQLAVMNSLPAEGGVKRTYETVNLYFSAPVGTDNVKPYISVTPSVTNLDGWYSDYDHSIGVTGDFLPETSYSVRVDPDLPDPWGGTLGEAYVLNFSTEPLPPNVFISGGSDVLFLTPRDTYIPVQATNFYNVPMAVGSTDLPDFIQMVSSDNAYNIRQSYSSPDERSWTQSLDITPNQMQEVPLSLMPDGSAMEPGLYYLKIDLPQDQPAGQQVNLMVVSNINMTFKLSATEALIWAVDLRDNQPVRNAPISILDKNGQPLASGTTDEQGIFKVAIPAQQDMYSTYFAVLGLPGEDRFSMALSTWNMGSAPWDFGINPDFSGPALKAYLYTDRPIYRPGQTVYFRGIVRQAYNGRYTIPDIASLPLTLYKNYSEEIASFDLPLSPYGTIHGEYTLPADAQPGDYRLASMLNEFAITVNFQVAEYRKPEINLQVDLSGDQVLAGETLTAQVNARYFFDAPAGNVPLRWTLLEENEPFYLPDYQVGVIDTRWLELIYPPQHGFSSQVDSGEATTDPQGLLTLELPTKAADSRKRYTLEVTATDESGFPVSARDSIVANPAKYYIGLRPDSWVGRAEKETGFDVLVVDWEKQPAGSRSLRAEFQKVTWERDESKVTDPRFIYPEFVAKYTPVASTDFKTGEDGKARIAFTPPEPGNYQLDVSGDGTRTQFLLWVGGPGQVTWPNLPNQRLRLTADRQEYNPGDTAQIFVPNPYPVDTSALVSIERGTLLRQQVETIPAGGSTISLPLSTDDAPNVYVSVTLLGQNEQGYPDYRQGYLEIPVAPTEQTLNVDLTSQPERAGPGDQVTLNVKVTDSSGQPVQGEFSLSLVDLAALALADPNAPDIVPAFYGEQPLGVRTGLPLGAYPQTEARQPGGMGGGGGEMTLPFVRERFPDTAYWNAEIVTDANGRSQVSLALPDNLTTWQATTRGVTEDTRVGQSDASLITTKDLLIRPVTPRFLVVGDHIQLAAVVQNNTSQALQVTAALQADGLALDDPSVATLQLDVPANGRQRVEWWGTVQDVDSADLTFSASAGSLQDAVRTAGGQIPVLHYSAAQAFTTAGTLDEGGKRVELVSLPRSFDPQGGTLKLELSSSLSGALFSALDVLELYPYECTEQTLSRFLPNLELYRVLLEYNVQSPATQSRLERTLGEGLERLLAYQNQDGGWSWWQGGNSDPFVSAYALFGLLRARQAGSQVSEDAIQRGVNYLTATLTSPQSVTETWQLDRLAFVDYVLAQAGSGSPAQSEALFQVRDQLSPWSQALLALTLESYAQGNESTRTLVSDLEGSAIRSASGAHWEEQESGYINMSTPVSTSSIVVYSLAQLDPKSPVLVDAMRYLMANRQADGAWGSTYSTAWTVMAGAEYLRATGELAGDFAYSAELNSLPLSSGQAGGDGAPVSSEVPVAKLYPEYPNALSIQRADGAGRLYYSAVLDVRRPVEEAAPLDRGISISRAYYPYSETCSQVEDCAAIHEAAAGELVKVRLTLTLKNPAYYLLVEDYLPAGSEILNTGLKTSQQALLPEDQPLPLYDPEHPYEQGWGWWLFSAPRVYDDRIAWAVDYLPAGTYQLTYYLSVLQPGEYRVLPARAWQFYFPDVQGNSAGELFAIKPSN